MSPHSQIEKRLEPVEAGEGNEAGQAKPGCTIFLGYTSNLISSGVRESIRYLAEHKMVNTSCLFGTKYQAHRLVSHNLPDWSALGGCDCDHGWRRWGGFYQVSCSHVPGRLQSLRKGAPPERHQQVGSSNYGTSGTQGMVANTLKALLHVNVRIVADVLGFNSK